MDAAQNVSTVGSGLNFQKIILIIAITILIVSLVFIGMQIKKSNSKQVWPPFVPQCPDFWKMNAEGSCVPTTAAQNKCNITTGINFTEGVYAGTGGACKKREWATECNAAWEGITYGTKDPCNNTSIK